MTIIYLLRKQNSKLNWNFNSICIVAYCRNNYELTLQTPELQNTQPRFIKTTVLLDLTSSSTNNTGNSLYIDILNYVTPKIQANNPPSTTYTSPHRSVPLLINLSS
jgi:hypothetical protein